MHMEGGYKERKGRGGGYKDRRRSMCIYMFSFAMHPFFPWASEQGDCWGRVKANMFLLQILEKFKQFSDAAQGFIRQKWLSHQKSISYSYASFWNRPWVFLKVWSQMSCFDILLPVSQGNEVSIYHPLPLLCLPPFQNRPLVQANWWHMLPWVPIE